MSTSCDRRSRKRLATRQGISDAATRLFLERGFDAVTIDDIAAAADVGRMTVFNHFPRKEDMFFDRDEEGREDLRGALRQRAPDVAPIETLRRLAHRIVDEERSYVRFTAGSRRFIETIEASETLKARSRAIRDEIADDVARALAHSVSRDPSDRDARLAATMLVATWTLAFLEAHRTFRRTRDPEQAKAVLLALVEQGSRGLQAALAGTPYV